MTWGMSMFVHSVASLLAWATLRARSDLASGNSQVSGFLAAIASLRAAIPATGLSKGAAFAAWLPSSFLAAILSQAVQAAKATVPQCCRACNLLEHKMKCYLVTMTELLHAAGVFWLALPNLLAACLVSIMPWAVFWWPWWLLQVLWPVVSAGRDWRNW